MWIILAGYKVNFIPDMPRPSEAQYDRDTGYLTFHVELSSLKLLAKVCK